jgi:hypothetical protein
MAVIYNKLIDGSATLTLIVRWFGVDFSVLPSAFCIKSVTGFAMWIQTIRLLLVSTKSF